MRPLSRGYVEAKTNQPGDMPAINPRYLSDETDRRAIIGGLRFARRLFDAPPLKQFVREESQPDRDVQTDDELLDYARRNGSPMCCVHIVFVVHGIEGLPVIFFFNDTATTEIYTNAPTIMIAEQGAAMIRGAARQRLAA
jgi:choline dehydrogenase